MNNIERLYDQAYFENRKSNDLKRMASFLQEKAFISKYINLDATVCDIGCSTGEFLSAIEWQGPKYGMEINQEAIAAAKKSGIDFDANILNVENFFDVVIFRGTIQHLQEPFTYIANAYSSLKKGGAIIFLATPNANSPVYKLFNTLPALDPRLNFYIPTDLTLSSILENSGFKVLEVQKPYLKSPYSNLIANHLEFFYCYLMRRDPKFAFWGSMMNMIAIKND